LSTPAEAVRAKGCAPLSLAVNLVAAQPRREYCDWVRNVISRKELAWGTAMIPADIIWKKERRTMKTKSIAIFYGLTAAFAVLFLAGCAGTHQARGVHTSGFLGDYSMLREGTGDQAMLVYVNPKTDFKPYTKILLDPIKVYPGVKDSSLSEIKPEDLKKLVDYLDATVRAQLSERFVFVAQPGPDVMRVRIALTEADSSNVPLDVVSSVIPVGMAVSLLQSVAFGRGSGVGSVSAELDVQDARTSERLMAAVDRRIGDKYTGQFDKFDKWHATQEAFDYWAGRMNTRLIELKNRQ
jgi:hypothetical protein